MQDDLYAFFERSSHERPSWKDRLAPWAHFGARRCEQLAALRPGEHEMLLAAVHEVRTQIDAAKMPVPDDTKETVAKLSGLVHGMASWLHESSIPLCETEAVEAARDIDQSAMQILRAMDRDYGMH